MFLQHIFLVTVQKMFFKKKRILPTQPMKVNVKTINHEENQSSQDENSIDKNLKIKHEEEDISPLSQHGYPKLIVKVQVR